MTAWVVFALMVGTALIARGLGRINTVVPARPVYDLVVDWGGARAFVDGYNPYSPEGQARAGLTAVGNGHPPTTFFWIIPLARQPLKVARETLLQIGLLLLLVELVLLARDLGMPAPWPSGWLALGLVLSCDWIDFLFYLGQLSQLIAFAYFLAWYCLRRGWNVAGGLAVGAACTLKVYPGVLLLFLMLGRRWRAVVAAASLYAVVAVIMTSRFGVGSWYQYSGQLRRDADRWMASIQNQAIHGLVLRFFHPTCLPRGGLLPLATAISTTTAAVLLVISGWLARRAARIDQRIDVPFALAAVLSVFTANWAWEHYNVLYLLPLAVVLAYVPRVRAWGYGWGWTAAIGGLFLAAASALTIPVLKKAEVQNAYVHNPKLHFQLHFFEALNVVPVLSLITALGLLLWLQERRERPESGSQDPTLKADFGPFEAQVR